MRFYTLFGENFRIALRSIRSNLLRTSLTILIIAFGIMALVGILTAIDSIKGSISDQFTRMGSNTFTIKIKEQHTRGRPGGGQRDNNNREITYREAQDFKKRFTFPAKVSVYAVVSNVATIKFNSEKTNPNIPLLGVDENYVINAGLEIENGRNFSSQEIQMNRNYVIIGSELAENLFLFNQDPIGKDITIGSGKYRVIGVLKEKGSSMGSAGDKICLLPLTNARQNFPNHRISYEISVMPTSGTELETAIGEATGLFRIVRKLNIKDAENFEIVKSDSLVNMLFENISYVTIAATLIGIITLIGAAIGLMNIMLVAVSEKTREIGTRKALGATSGDIRWQFLFETIIIGQLGGALGIFFGIMAGNGVSLLTGGPFIVPWMWILFGVVICLFVSIISGMAPAMKAARLDPIIALRHE